MDGAFEFRRKRCIYHAVALDPALPFEGRRYDIDPEMRLAAGPVAREDADGRWRGWCRLR